MINLSEKYHLDWKAKNRNSTVIQKPSFFSSKLVQWFISTLNNVLFWWNLSHREDCLMIRQNSGKSSVDILVLITNSNYLFSKIIYFIW